MDELLAVLGYQVRSYDMVEVAQKLELLKDLMGNAQGDGLSQLAYETVQYNPSDLSTWLQSMLSEFNPLPVNGFDPMVPHATDAVAPPTPLDDSILAPAESSTITSIDFDQQNNINHSRVFEDSSSSDYDLKAILCKAMYSQPQSHSQSWTTQIESPSSRDAKWLKLSSASSSNPDAN